MKSTDPSTPPVTRTRILVVDDHPMVRDWITQLINREPDLQICGEAADGKQALEAIARELPRLVILDLSMRHSHGTDLIKEIVVSFPDVLVLVLSMYEESLYAERALRAGARGYITKEEAGDNIKKAIRAVLDGQIYVSAAISARMMARASSEKSSAAVSPVDRLSDRELEVFRQIGQGHTPTEIAHDLNVSIKTIEGYLARLKEKLAIEDAGELRRQAILFNKLGP